MQYIFDASSVYYIVKSGRIDLLANNYTTSLARYELGNVLLKERYILKKMSDAEQRSLLNIITQALDLMFSADISGNEQEIIDLAAKHSLSFYDASYVYLSKKNGIVLVTEDNKLINKIKTTVKAIQAETLM